MRSSRIYIDSDLSTASEITLPADRAHYVKNVLRLKKGDRISVFNGRDDQAYSADLHIDGKKVSAIISKQLDSLQSSTAKITLLQAIGKSEHMDLLVQKTTELGIDRLVFFNSDRTQSPLKGSRLQKRLIHWHAVAVSACEQCGRNRLPLMDFINDLNGGLQLAEADDNKLLLNFDSPRYKQVKRTFNAPAPFSVLIGAEGGLTEREIEQAKSSGYQPCQLGPRTLRMETAAIAATTLLQMEFGDLG